MRNNVLGTRVPGRYSGTRVPAQNSRKYSRVPGYFPPEISGYPFRTGTRWVSLLVVTKYKANMHIANTDDLALQCRTQ